MLCEKTSTVQSLEARYELHTLGWKAFQDLYLTVTSEVLGQTVQAFLPYKDGGRDGAFHGLWNTPSGDSPRGAFTVQCKFTSKRDAILQRSHLDDELKKAERLADKGLATNYLLITNFRISATTEETIREAFLSISGIDTFLLYGAEWLTLHIRENSRLRMLVPRVYGLGDLSQILDERRYAQARAILDSMGDDLGKFVITDAYRKSAGALREHGFVLLLGEPASGKSTIAASLAIGAIDSLGCSTMKIRSAEEFVQHWNPLEPRQFFWVDDAFGATQYQKESALEWSRVFPHMQTAIKRGARVLFTSRDYIYRSARTDLKASAFPLIDESQVVIYVQNLTLGEKNQILYNHMKLGNQASEFRTTIKPFLPMAAQSQLFLPETARRLGNRLFTKTLSLNKDAVLGFVDRPLPFLVDVLRGLDRHSLASLAMVFMNGGSLQSPISLTDAESKALQVLGSTLASVREALHAMDGSLVRYVKGEQPRWDFQHPTVRDALATLIAEDPELLDIYLCGTPTQKLLQEVTSGNVGIQGVKVMVPATRYSVLAERLAEWQNYDQKCAFLAYRCDRPFLHMYIDRDPDLLVSMSQPGSYLSACIDTQLLVKLYKLGLLPEEIRSLFVADVMELAIETPDADFLTSSGIREVFTQEEIEGILDAVRQRLIPKLSKTISNWRYNCGRLDEPEEYFQPLVEALEAYRNEFATCGFSISGLEIGLNEIADVVEELRQARPTIAPSADNDVPLPAIHDGEDQRNIFDDVDQ